MQSWSGWEDYDRLPERDETDRLLDWASIILVLVLLVIFAVWQS